MNRTSAAPPYVTASEHLETWSGEYMPKLKGNLPNTVKLYRRTLEAIETDLGNPDVLTTEQIEAWLYRKGGCAGTMSNRISALRSFYKYLVRIKAIPTSPMEPIDAPRKRKGLPKPIGNGTPEEIEAAFKLLDEIDRVAHDRLAGDQKHLRPLGQSRAMATFILETGLRMHEAEAINVPVPAPEAVTVIGKGAKEAMILLTDTAREALDFLGGRWPIGARATQRRFEKAGFHPHQLRHTLGCQLAASGADLGEIQDLLRHSSPATTKGYAAYSTDRLRAAQARRQEVAAA